jgi:Fe2+ transport system protein FeoA
LLFKFLILTTLDQIKLNSTQTIKAVREDVLSAKLIDMGLYPGKDVSIIFKAPFGDPIAIDVQGYTLSLRKHEASLIEVE